MTKNEFLQQSSKSRRRADAMQHIDRWIEKTFWPFMAFTALYFGAHVVVAIWR